MCLVNISKTRLSLSSCDEENKILNCTTALKSINCHLITFSTNTMNGNQSRKCTSPEAPCGIRRCLTVTLSALFNRLPIHSLFFLDALAMCHPCTHTDAVSIMAGCCLYSDPIFPDRRRAICFVCHTKRKCGASASGSPLNTNSETHQRLYRDVLQ